MTTIDHQQAAVEAAKDALAEHQIGEDWGDDGVSFVGCDCGQWFGKHVNDGKELARTHEAQAALTAATPHLRAEFIAEVRQAQFEVEARHHFGFGEGGIKCLCGFASPRNRSRTEHITRAVLALLEGGAE